jgi:hypothetical protein
MLETCWVNKPAFWRIWLVCLLAECHSCTVLCTFCTVTSPFRTVSTSEVSIKLMCLVSDNGGTRPEPYFRCGRCLAESFCCHGHSCVTIVGQCQHAHCQWLSTNQAVCYCALDDVSTMYEGVLTLTQHVTKHKHHVTRHNTPIHNILSTAAQLSISQKALGTLPEDGNVMPKHVGATIHS